MLEVQPGWQIVAEAGDGREAVAIAGKTRPAVAVLRLGRYAAQSYRQSLTAIRAFLKTDEGVSNETDESSPNTS